MAPSEDGAGAHAATKQFAVLRATIDFGGPSDSAKGATYLCDPCSRTVCHCRSAIAPANLVGFRLSCRGYVRLIDTNTTQLDEGAVTRQT